MNDAPDDRAHTLIAPYLGRPGVIGAYLVGSATRPYRDGLSDLDLELIVEDAAYDATQMADRHIFVVDEGPPRRVDHEVYLRAWSDFVALADTRQDLIRAGYRHALVLHDPDGRIAPLVEALAALPDDAREARLRVHWLELLFGVGRAKKTLAREKPLDARLVLAGALRAAVKLLFVAAGRWPAAIHWTREELELLDAPAEAVGRCAGSTDLDDWQALVEAVRTHLASRGLDFHEDTEGLMRWGYLTAEGRAAFERWGAA